MLSLKDNFLAGYKVLVVDDEPDGAYIAELLLARYGAEVFKAKNGRVGLEIAQQEQPQLIISDLTMPQMDGWKMVEALKANDKTKNIPVIALTGHAMFGERERVIEAGFHNYLSKPLKPRTFVHDLMALLIDLPEFAALVEREG